MRDRLEQLVGEMVDKGIRYDDAQREFEKRFIARVRATQRRQPRPGRQDARHASQHADAQTAGPEDRVATATLRAA